MTQYETTHLLLACGALNDIAEKLIYYYPDSGRLRDRATSEQVKEVQLLIEFLVVKYLPWEIQEELKNDERYSHMLTAPKV